METNRDFFHHDSKSSAMVVSLAIHVVLRVVALTNVIFFARVDDINVRAGKIENAILSSFSGFKR